MSNIITVYAWGTNFAQEHASVGRGAQRLISSSLPQGLQILKISSKSSQNFFVVILYLSCGQRPSVLGQDRSETKKSVFVLQVWCCVVKHGLVMLIVVMILKDTTTQLVKYNL